MITPCRAKILIGYQQDVFLRRLFRNPYDRLWRFNQKVDFGGKAHQINSRNEKNGLGVLVEIAHQHPQFILKPVRELAILLGNQPGEFYSLRADEIGSGGI